MRCGRVFIPGEVLGDWLRTDSSGHPAQSHSFTASISGCSCFCKFMQVRGWKYSCGHVRDGNRIYIVRVSVGLRHSNSISVILLQWYGVWDDEKTWAYTLTERSLTSHNILTWYERNGPLIHTGEMDCSTTKCYGNDRICTRLWGHQLNALSNWALLTRVCETLYRLECGAIMDIWVK